MNSDNKIIIELNNIRAKKYHHNDGAGNHILLDKYYEKIADLIADRIDEVNHYKSLQFDIDNINEVKMHDAILVYGSRGNGKSTVMINLKDFITGEYSKDVENTKKLKDKVRIFETIDPTIQEEDEDFLLVILSAILKEVESYQEHKYTNRDKFYDSLENVLKIVEATRSSNKDNIDIFDKFYGLKSGVGLAEELHNLFKATKDIFGVEILVIPIDDVDMNLKQGYQIADSIRKYMSSPYIIPIVAFNIRQMRVVTKYNKYKEFGLDIDKEIDMEELSFLRSLPNDYLSKVFPPNRRIYLKSVYEILKNRWNEEKIIFRISSREDSQKRLELKTLDMVSLISELFYETYYNKNSFQDMSASTFLTNRSMRNFLNDCYAILLSLKKNDENDDCKIDWRIIKDRLAPDDIYAFVTKEHALTWLWNEYIKLAKKNLVDENNILKNYNWAKMVTETLPEDNSAEIINKKTYARIWLQKYYRTSEKITKEPFINLNTREYNFSKTCDITGALELAMRSYIPMYLFENIVRNHNLKYDNSDLIYLKSFASRSLQGIAYELSMMEATLYKKQEETRVKPKPIGAVVVFSSYKASMKDGELAKISDKEFNIPFLFKVSNQDKLVTGSNSEQIYILSIFKSLAFFIELMKIYKNKDKSDIEIKELIERFRVNMPDVENATTMKDDYFNDCIEEDKCSPFKETEKLINRLNIEFKNSSFGILEIASFSKRLVNFFMNVRDNISGEELMNFNLEKKTKDVSDFHLPLITYFTSFSQSLLISLFHSVQKDNVIAIQTKEGEDKIIFRKNSLYGTKGNLKKDDHLYEKNILNLKNIVENNNSDNEQIAKVQQDFNDLFQYINNDIPFFKFLIDKAEFLEKIKD